LFLNQEHYEAADQVVKQGLGITALNWWRPNYWNNKRRQELLMNDPNQMYRNDSEIGGQLERCCTLD
jgi:hypothetical protein